MQNLIHNPIIMNNENKNKGDNNNRHESLDTYVDVFSTIFMKVVFVALSIVACAGLASVTIFAIEWLMPFLLWNHPAFPNFRADLVLRIVMFVIYLLVVFCSRSMEKIFPMHRY